MLVTAKPSLTQQRSLTADTVSMRLIRSRHSGEVKSGRGSKEPLTMALHKPFWSLALNGSFPCSSQAVVVVDDACYREPASMAELCMGWRLPLQQVDTSVACGA